MPVCRSLCHPHIATPTLITRTSDHLCVLTRESNGGGLFAMARRSGDAGLAVCAAVFMTQQIAAAAEFMHGSGLYLHELSLAALQVNWSDTGMPLVMVHTFQLPSEAEVRPPPPPARRGPCGHLLK